MGSKRLRDGRGMNCWLPAQLYLWCYWGEAAFGVLGGARRTPLPPKSAARSASPHHRAAWSRAAETWAVGTDWGTAAAWWKSWGTVEGRCLWRNGPWAGRCGGKSCWKRGLGCRLMLTRLLILFLSDLVEIPRHPKDKVWKLSCKLVPLKSKQTMNPWSNYTRNFPDFSALM